MCGRITTTYEFSRIRLRWNLDSDLPIYAASYNIAPETASRSEQGVPVIVCHDNRNECRPILSDPGHIPRMPEISKVAVS
jgi:hypothetical protein